MDSITSTPPAHHGLRGIIGTTLRSLGSGYGTMASNTAEQSAAAIAYPADGVSASTRILRDSTANVPVLRKITAAFDKFGGIGVGTVSAQAYEGYERPGSTISNAAHMAADLIDGQHSTNAWTSGYTKPLAGRPALLRASETGNFLASLGIR